jgi:peptidoglycan/xylan/chitin deacetylase (PgdA/CDA1 family)
MYHRISDEPVDHWNLSVSPAHFEEHLRVIRRTRHALSLGDFVNHHTTGTLRPDAVALTFDDGYADNLIFAKPRLAVADVPATVFLSTGFLDRPSEFWWDELARLMLRESGPRSFDVIIRGERVHFEFAMNTQASDRRVKDGAPAATRQGILMAVYQVLRRLDHGERQSSMAELRSIFSARGCQTNRGRAMTRDEVRRLILDGLITIGAHTVTHPVLPELRAPARERELAESKIACEELAEAPVAGFAYPYGEFDAVSRAAVIAAGFGFACAAQNRSIAATSDVFALPRIQIRDCNGDAFEQTLRSASVG